MNTKKAKKVAAKPSKKPAEPKTAPPRNPRDTISEEQKARARAAELAGAAPPRKERAPKKDADIPRSGTCLCGCGATMPNEKALFLPGHDSKAKSRIMTEFYGNSVARFVLAHRGKPKP